MYEGALRQAAIARWPGKIPANKVNDEPWAFWDFLPTAVELANAKLPDDFKTDGVSLVSFLKGGMVPNRDCFYWELHEGTPIQAVRFGDWKAVRNAPGSKIELFDLKSDPGEKNDLAAQMTDLVLKAEKLMRTSRIDDPNWPMVARQNQKNNNKKK